MTFLEIILDIIDKKNITKNKMLTDLKLSKNSFVAWSNRGTIPNGETLIKIADYLDCSVDYLLGRTNNPNFSTNNILNSTVTGSSVVQGNNSSNIVVGNNNTYKSDNDTKKKELSKQALEFAEIFDSLGIRQQAKLLSTLDELEKELKKNL